jgi:hypothetical protein
MIIKQKIDHELLRITHFNGLSKVDNNLDFIPLADIQSRIKQCVKL